MSLPILNLTEPLVTALVGLLQSNLNATIDTLNASLSDSFKLDHVAQFVPYIPVPSTLAGGTPAIGVGRLGGDFVDDLQVNMDAVHRYGVMSVVENSDQGALGHQLERMLQAVAYTIQQDRLAGNPTGSASVMRTQGGAWSVNFVGYEPGPMLGEANPEQPDGPPRSFLSWDLLVLSSKRTEI